MPTLAKIDVAPADERGPDVVHQVTVPPDWLEAGASFECELPRRLRCARCEGGGCDGCARSGAIVLCEADEPLRRVVVHLASGESEPRALRLLDEGGVSDRRLPRGCLILRLEPGALGSGVHRLDGRSRVGNGTVWVLAAALLLLAIAFSVHLWS